MIIVGSALVVERPGRSVVLQPMNEQTYYTALRAFGLRESVAIAATRGLITIRIGGLR
jgi:hypothetical protein